MTASTLHELAQLPQEIKRRYGIEAIVLGLTFGELFVTGFIFLAVVTATYWPRLGEKLFVTFSRTEDTPADPTKKTSSDE
jgi:hypothetical protein